MKKIALFFIFFFSIATQAALPTGAGEFQVNVPLFNGNWEFGATGYFLKPSFSQVDYVLLFPTVDSEEGHFKSVRPKYKLGYELYLGYLIPCTGNDMQLAYANYDETSHDHTGQHEGIALSTLTNIFTTSVFVPSVLAQLIVGPFAIGAALFGPAMVPVTGTIQEASVRDEMRQINLDFDVGQYINVDTFFKIRLFTGLRYTRLRHNLVADYIIGNFTGTETNEIPIFALTSLISTLTVSGISQIEETIDESSRFNGLGPRIGMDGSFHLGGGFGLVGHIATAALIGRETDGFRRTINGDVVTQISSITTISTTPGVPVTIISTDPPVGFILADVPVSQVNTLTFDKATRVVPNIEARIGLNYTTQFSNSCRTFTLEIGYYVNHYFDAVDTISVGDTLQAAVNVMDVSFSGPYLDLCFTL